MILLKCRIISHTIYNKNDDNVARPTGLELLIDLLKILQLQYWVSRVSSKRDEELFKVEGMYGYWGI